MNKISILNNISSLITLKTISFSKEQIDLVCKSQLETLSKILINKRFIILGGGSNVLFVNDFNGIVVKNKLKGIKVIEETNHDIIFSIASGEIWHNLVIKLNSIGAYGLENLALIPGTVGAAPIQNIGAYGVEISEFVYSVSVYDIYLKKEIELKKSDCGFDYRYSFFKKKSWQKKYIITKVNIKLSKHFKPNLSYDGISPYKIPISAKGLLEKVIKLRNTKLPDPQKLPNAGSFFKNPIIQKSDLDNALVDYGMPCYDAGNGKIKLSAAWLIEKAGFKGIRKNNGAGVYDKHALILVNYGGARGVDLYELSNEIIDTVIKLFNIRLEPEVRIIKQ